VTLGGTMENRANAKPTAQDRANAAAWEDGRRCRLKGLGFKGELYDYHAWDRLFERGFRAFCRGIDREECREEWREGWHCGDDQIEARRHTSILPSGHKI